MQNLKKRLAALEQAAPSVEREQTPLHRLYGEPDPPDYKPVYWSKTRTLADFYGDTAQTHGKATQ